MPDRGSLSERLRIIRESGKGQDSHAGGTGASAKPGGRGPAPLTVDRLSFEWKRIGAYTWKRETLFPAAGAGPIALFHSPPSQTGSEGIDPSRFVFFDAETTGLSGGAGTIIFLAGFGRITPAGVSVRQYFLSDYPGEREFLSALLDVELSSPSILTSYNGKCFDLPLLRGRLILNGFTLPVFEQYDLLHPARTCWKSMLSGCSLGDIEREIIGIARKGDIPGSLIPARYFSYLSSRDPALLSEVFSHHLQDVRSLEILTRRLSEIWTRPEAAFLVDRRKLGTALLRAGRSEGERARRNAFSEGDWSAGQALGAYLKRTGRVREAAGIWEAMVENGGFPNVLRELAMYHEHKTGDLRKALLFTERLRSAAIGAGGAPFLTEDALVVRRERILRKLGKVRGADSAPKDP
jgi:uncharacterized protein YprB with RNaseH-like and TPR domain